MQSLKGQVANSGIISGTVRLVNPDEKTNILNRDEIIVAKYINPKLFPDFKKAAAFVVEEGSLTCHVAKIAREINKPCLVDVKNATETLKEGMRVEVDANIGEVRIVED